MSQKGLLREVPIGTERVNKIYRRKRTKTDVCGEVDTAGEAAIEKSGLGSRNFFLLPRTEKTPRVGVRLREREREHGVIKQVPSRLHAGGTRTDGNVDLQLCPSQAEIICYVMLLSPPHEAMHLAVGGHVS